MCDRTRKLSSKRRDRNLCSYCAHLQRIQRGNKIVNWIEWIHNQMPSIHDLNGWQQIDLNAHRQCHWSVMTTTLIVQLVFFYLASQTTIVIATHFAVLPQTKMSKFIERARALNGKSLNSGDLHDNFPYVIEIIHFMWYYRVFHMKWVQTIKLTIRFANVQFEFNAN